MPDLVIREATVVTMDSQRRIFRKADIEVSKGAITSIQPSSPTRPAPGTQVIEASGKVALPGLIDGHLHTNHFLAKGIGDDIPLVELLYQRAWPYEAQLTPEEVYLSALGNFCEMIKHGTTTFADPGGVHMDQVGEAMKDIGIRGVLSRCTMDVADGSHPLRGLHVERTEEACSRGEAFIRKWNGRNDGLIRAWYSLRSCPNVSNDLCREIKRLADRDGVGIHGHAASYSGENEAMRKQWGFRTLERYHRLGLFGPNLYLVHMGWGNEQEVDKLKNADVKVCHCPSASIFHAMGCVRQGMFPVMLRKGVNVCLGTDTVCAGRFLDMFRVMYLAACVHKEMLLDPTAVGAYKALEMATIDGARALLWDDRIGSIEVGKEADILLLSLSSIDWWPVVDLVGNLVYSVNGSCVDTVVIRGEIILKSGRLTRVNEEELIQKIQRASEASLRRAGIKIPKRWPVIE